MAFYEGYWADLAIERERQLTTVAQIKQLEWPIAERQIEHRKSRLVLSARFPVVDWRSRSFATSAYWGSVREWRKARLVSICASLRESSPSCVSSRVPLTRDFSQYPPNGELTRRLAPRAPLTLNSLLVRQNRKLNRINTMCICV